MLQYIKKFFENNEKRKFIALYIVLPMVINLIIETLGRKSIFGGVIYLFTNPLVFLYNSTVIMFTLSFALLIRRREFYISTVSVIWITFGIANGVLLSFRPTPFTANELMNVDDALGVLSKYMSVFTCILIITLFVITIGGIVFIWIKGPKVKGKINYLKNLVIIGIMTVVVFGSTYVGNKTDILATRFGNIANAYLDYGFPYCFANSLLNTGIDKPKDYSPEVMDALVEDETTTPEKESNAVIDVTQSATKPNIIFIQLESFFDITKAKDLTFSEDPIPNFRKLMNNYTTGYLDVPCVGAGTANTEFEVLTGMDLDFFGPGEYPYKTVLKTTTCESLSYNLKENGYVTHAIHNNTGTFYKRHRVFSQLGFDTYTSLEYMQLDKDNKTATGWAKDNILPNEIFKCLNSTEGQDLVYTITVQSHGSYPSDTLENPEITVSGIEDEALKNSTEYYVNQIHEVDKVIGDLINQLSTYDEDTILVMFGDHLPSLNFTDESLENGTVYQTEYVVWNNMGMPKQDEEVEAYQLSSKVMQSIGIDTGVINKYHQTNKGEDKDEYLDGLQLLEYDVLYGDLDVYGGINPYTASDLQMGIDPIEITNIRKDPDNEGTIIVEGTNFTTASRVFVNGDSYETEFVNPTTLKIKYSDVKVLDSFVVGQMTSETFALSKTKECLYYGN